MTLLPEIIVSPPRAERAIPPGLIDVFEGDGYWAQAKKNGQYSVIHISPDGQVFIQNRHGKLHKNWEPSEDTLATLRVLGSPKGWTVICAELLHAKVPGLRDVHFVHDVLCYEGVWQHGTTYAQRYALLLKMFNGDCEFYPDKWVFPGGIWLAKNYTANLRTVFDQLRSDEDEGIVLKNPRYVLYTFDDPKWTMKVRWAKKGFNF